MKEALKEILKEIDSYEYMDQGRGTGNPQETLYNIRKIAKKALK